MNAEKKLNATSTRKAAPLRTAAVITLYGEDMKSAGKALSFKWLKVNWDKGKI